MTRTYFNMSIKNTRLFSGTVAVLFLCLTALVVKTLLRFEHYEDVYGILFLFLGILLDAGYLTIHFSLRTLFSNKLRFASAFSCITAGIVAIPLTIIGAYATSVYVIVLLEPVFYHESQSDSLLLLWLIALSTTLLIAPSFFLWRHFLQFFKSKPNDSIT